jgi:hypothetical protein
MLFFWTVIGAIGCFVRLCCYVPRGATWLGLLVVQRGMCSTGGALETSIRVHVCFSTTSFHLLPILNAVYWDAVGPVAAFLLSFSLKLTCICHAYGVRHRYSYRHNQSLDSSVVALSSAFAFCTTIFWDNEVESHAWRSCLKTSRTRRRWR